MKNFVIIAVAIGLVGCTAPDRSHRILTENGYTDIELTGYSWFACGQDDAFSTGFVATSPAGKRVEGTVCAGWFKGATIRFD